MSELFWMCFAAFTAGMVIGVNLEASRWRSKGDHEYMNTIESGGALYTVKAEYEP